MADTPGDLEDPGAVPVSLKLQPLARRVGIMSARALAEATGINRNSAADLWADRTNRYDRDTLSRLCTALRCKPADLWAEE